MPYAKTSELPAAVREKLSPKRQRQWMHVWNTEYESHHNEDRAYASAWAATKKDSAKKLAKAAAAAAPEFNIFLPLTKVKKNDDGTCTVSGYASTESLDLDGEIISLDAVRKALPGYWEWRNIREMHAPRAVGVAKEAHTDEKGLFLTSRIVDPSAVQKVIEGVYKGYSVGGKKLAKKGNVITEIDLIEVSIVDRPANPDCRITVAKHAKPADGDAAVLVKSESNPPAHPDGFSKPHKVKKRDFNAKQRRDAADSGAAMPDGSFPIKSVEDLHNAIQAVGRSKNPKKAKAHIVARAKDLGQSDLIPESWRGGGGGTKSARKLAKRKQRVAQLAASLDLRKGMYCAGQLSYAFDSLRNVQRGLIMESKREGGDKKDLELASRVGRAARDIADVIGQKAAHEGSEALDLTDADDQGYGDLLVEDSDMGKKAVAAAAQGAVVLGDPLEQALLNVVKRAATPSRAQRMAMARANMKKARTARKDCAASIEKVYDMMKGAVLAKAAGAKKDKKDGPDSDGDFDFSKALDGLQKAYGALTTQKTFLKAAVGQLEKMQSERSGQRGEEPGTPVPGVYEVPPGVKPLSQAEMSTLGTYAGGPRGTAPDAAKSSLITREHAEALAKAAGAEARASLLERMPMGRARPVAFDVSKAAGDNTGADLNKIIYDGVDMSAFSSGNDHVVKGASARVIGNYLTSAKFGKSVLDPAFRGTAGGTA